ncbi:MAG: glycosyltransferase family 4 protein [Parvibaculum sp.]
MSPVIKSIQRLVASVPRATVDRIVHIIDRSITRKKLTQLIGAKNASAVIAFWNRRILGEDHVLHPPPPTDVCAHFSFVATPPFGVPIGDAAPPDRRTINFFVPEVGRGSGGHLNIFRFMVNLMELGYECRLIVCNSDGIKDAEWLAADIADWFQPLGAKIYFWPEDAIPQAHFSFATGWQTAYPVNAFRGTRHRFYLVQDFEPYFYAHGSEYAFAEQSYRLPLKAITAGQWLADKLRDEYGMEATPIGFSYDKHLYRPIRRRGRDVQHVLFYARPVTPRRGFELGLMTLTEVSRRLPHVKFILAGWDVSNYAISFDHLNAGIVPLSELPDLYGQCDAALVISLTNLSLLPLELMACGCAVVSNSGPNVEWLLNRDNAALADATVHGLAGALQRVLEDNAYKEKIVEAGFRTVGQTDWLAEARHIAEILEKADA